MFSARERSLRENSLLSCSEEERTRVSFKDSLFSLLMHFTGIQGKKACIFGLHNPTGGGVHIILFVSSLRLDLANRTVVLDAVVLPLYDDLMPKIKPLSSSLCTNRCEWRDGALSRITRL